MCKELQVILVNKVVDPKRIIGKMEGRGGGEAQGVADQKKHPNSRNAESVLMRPLNQRFNTIQNYSNICGWGRRWPSYFVNQHTQDANQ
jgi:hypothetical protein